MNWNTEALGDAKDLIENFKDEVTEQLLNKGEASDDWNNDYPNGDSYFHESYVDKSYSLTKAAELLDELDEYEETDSGLWQGLSPKEAISTQAAYTYGNAVHFKAKDLIEEINEAWANREDAEHKEHEKETDKELALTVINNVLKAN
jgi:hypothetical protein